MAAKKKPRPRTSSPSSNDPLDQASKLLRAEFQKAKRRIAKLRASGSESFDELWEEVDRVLGSDPPLYLGGGYRSVEEYIVAELPGETARSVKRNVLVARCFSPEDEARHGINFLEEVALYARDLAGAGAAPRAIHLDRLTIAVPTTGGKTTRTKVRDATIEEVRKARRFLKGAASAKPASPAERTLRAALSKRKTLRSIAVRVSKRQVSFSGVPLEAVAELGEVLAKAGSGVTSS